MLYTRDQERSEEISDTPEKKKKMSDDESSSSCDESYNDPWQGLDNASTHCFKVTTVHSLAVLILPFYENIQCTIDTTMIQRFIPKFFWFANDHFYKACFRRFI